MRFSFARIIPLVPAINVDEVVYFRTKKLGFIRSFQVDDNSERAPIRVSLYVN